MDHNRISSLFAMLKGSRKYSILTGILTVAFLSLACNMPALRSSKGNGDVSHEVETRIAQTATARESDRVISNTETPIQSAEQRPTVSKTKPPLVTATETHTPTPESARVHVTGNTFCRSGPGSVYSQQAVLNMDEESEISAKDPTGNFWYINNPDQPTGKCWIWGNYATPEGNLAGLPVYTPPPTPTPTPGMAFSVSYDPPYVESGDYAQVFFLIENTGGIPFQSVTITVEGMRTYAVSTPMPESVTSTSNSFTSSRSGLSLKLDMIRPGNTAYGLSGEIRASDDLSASITVCSEDNLNGKCLTKNLSLPDR